MLSILIPSFNHADFVKEAISSVREIDVPGKQIYVIDDASQDNSADVIEQYLCEVDADVIFIRKPINKGLVDSILTFLSLCDTEYVYMIASDDVAIATGIAELVKHMEAKPTLAFAIGGGKNVFPDGSTSSTYSAKHDSFFGLDAENLVRETFLNCPSPILCQTSIFRMRAIVAVGGFDPSMIADDYALFTRLFLSFNRRCTDFVYLPEVDCVRYRHHETNSYLNLPRQALAALQVINRFAPTELRNRAVGEKLAFFALVAIQRLDLRALRSLVGMIKLEEYHWFAAGVIRKSIAHMLKR